MLDLRNNTLKELSFLKPLNRLKVLRLSLNELLVISVINIRHLNQLEILELDGNRLISVSFLLMTLPSLEYLDISGKDC